MAKSIQIRDVPDDVHRTLATRATGAGQSLSRYLREELVRMAAYPTVAEALDRARSRGRSKTLAVDQIVAAVRSGRDS